MTAKRSFSPALFAFLRDLEKNNHHDWFNANKPRYVRDVRDPMLDFIERFAPHLAKISGCFVADPRANGGSLFRIYRDVRFGRDKRPFKTNAGAQFRHYADWRAHSPGFYLHMEPGRVFAAGGVWHPDRPALEKIRDAIVDDPARWQEVTTPSALGPRGEMAGESMKRAPQDYHPDHPLIRDIKRKDFFALTRFTEKEACAAGFMTEFARACRKFSALTRFLTEALEHPW